MNDSTIVEKITEHDHHIDTLAKAIEDLATTTGQTNVKLDKVVDTMAAQNVIRERLNNMDSNLKDTFARVHSKIEDNETRISTNERAIDNLPSSTTIRWAAGLMLSYLAISGNYIVGHIHQLETWRESHEASAEQILKSFNEATKRNTDELTKHEDADALYYRDLANRLYKIETGDK